jgi:hypothetical protein
VQSVVAVQGQECDAHHDVLMLEVVAAAMMHDVDIVMRGGDDPPLSATMSNNAGRI